jgi:glycosyltransferase involved in cell wall biosynthesis
MADKKILFVTRTFEYGGAERHLLELLERLRQPELQISILCLGLDPYSERLAPEMGIAVRLVPYPSGSLSRWMTFFRRERPDVLVLVYGWCWCFHWIAPIAARLAGIPKRFAIQHLVLPAKTDRNVVSRGLRKLLGYPNLQVSASLLTETICVSDAVKESLVRKFGFPAKKMKTIHNGVSLKEFTPSLENGMRLRNARGIDAGEFVLICSARLSKQKGIDILLRAIARVRQDGLSCKCIVIGDGPLRDELVELTGDLGLVGQVFFEGFQSDVRPYLQAASALILTSHHEGLPLAILEAAACGLPCIVTDVGGNAEAVMDGVTGLVVPAGSVDAVANAICFLARHAQERQKMSCMARARMQREFDIEKCMSEIKNVILN